MTVAIGVKRIFKIIGGLSTNIIVLLLSLFCLFPVVWMMYSSLKDQTAFMQNVIALPRELHFANYISAFRIARMDVAFLNSLFVSIIAVIVLVFVSFLAGVIFGRYVFKGRNALYLMFLAGMLIPVHSLLIPIFIQLRNFDLTNNHVALALIYTAFGLPRAIFLITAFAATIPKEIEEAVIIDGGTTNNLFFRVFLPICKPIISTVVILSFLDAWNEFPFSLVLMGRPELQTLPVSLTFFSGQHSTDFAPLFAGLTIATLPVVIVYFIFHKKIMEGMVAGSVKG